MSKNKTHIISNLETLLADLILLSLKTRHFHWNVSGEHFWSLHAFFQVLYENLENAIDEIAERLRALDHIVSIHVTKGAPLSHIKEDIDIQEDQKMLHSLDSDYLLLIQDGKKIIHFAEKEDDFGTADLVTSHVREWEKFHWMIKSYALHTHSSH